MQQNDAVYLDEIALMLPVNEWFTTAKFIECTGIKYTTAGKRLMRLSEDEMIERRRPGYLCEYRMTEAHKEKMLKAGAAIVNKHCRQKEKPVKSSRSDIDKLLFSAALV